MRNTAPTDLRTRSRPLAVDDAAARTPIPHGQRELLQGAREPQAPEVDGAQWAGEPAAAAASDSTWAPVPCGDIGSTVLPGLFLQQLFLQRPFLQRLSL